ncbi:MAG: stage III sporulation protein AC [Clostridia bacterium]|nr:stage III sporulation protein AC [Clostridia bacterium]MBQ8333086.1 stage III sporulation protein AC [Clostridia bacterium]MBQ8370668.1 stage III sporulation protein AC [Clostridia bacterium]
MDVTLIFKIAGVGMIVAVSHQILQRAGRDDQALMLSLTGIVLVLLVIIGKVGELFSSIRSIFGI